MTVIEQVDELIRKTLCSFAADILTDSWTGRRENEAINLYVFGHLVKECRPGRILGDLTQIAIDSPVK